MKATFAGLYPTILMSWESLLLDLFVALLVVLDGVHLVDADDQLGDAERTCKEDVLLGLLHHAVGCGDDEQCSVCLGCTGDHVLDEVAVSGTVYNGEVELVGVEPLVGDVDGDTTLTLLFEVVHNPREFKRALTLGFSLLPVVLDDMGRYRSRLEQQPTHSRRLAMVNVANNC